jgi:hypothetical protein
MAIENINELAKFVKGGADVLQKAIESEDKTTLEFIDGRFVTDGDLETMKDTVRVDAKKEGQTIGYDFAMKDIKKDFGIELEGKDRKAIVEAVKRNILTDAKVEPNKKIAEYEISLGNLRKQYDTDKEVWDTAELSYKGKLKDISIMSELQKNTPEVTGLSVNQFTTLAKTVFDFDFDENNNLIAKKNGQPVKDKMERLIPVKDILTDYATQNGWFSSDGRNGKSEQGVKKEFESINDVYKHMETNNIQPNSPEGEKMLNEFNKD